MIDCQVGIYAKRALIIKLISLLVLITDNIQSKLIAIWFGLRPKWIPPIPHYGIMSDLNAVSHLIIKFKQALQSAVAS